jgi:predicted  nucleic acid-binding Zn-ribbon protein
MGLVFAIFSRKRIRAACRTEEDVADLEAKRTVLEADVSNLRQWITDSRVELERLHAEREQQEVIRVELQHLEQQCATKEQENQELRKEVGELENQRHRQGQNLERLSREIGDLEAKREDAKSLDQQLEKLRKQVEDAQEVASRAAEHEARINALAAEKATLEQRVEELKAAAAEVREAGPALVDLRRERDQLENLRQWMKDSTAEIERLHAEKAALEQRVEELKAAAAEVREAGPALVDLRRERDQIELMLHALHSTKNALEQDVRRLERQAGEVEGQLEKFLNRVREARQETENANLSAVKAKAELAEVQKELRSRQGDIEGLQARKAALEHEIEKIEGRNGTGVPSGNPFAPYADLLEVEPGALSRASFCKGDMEKRDEATALQLLKDALTDNGLSFHRRVVNSFHTSLKCHDINPLTVLAGVSGTGKTLLPVCYAQMMGMHSLIMSVQPRWDSPQDMFGFYNYLEKRYKATDLSRALVRMDPYNYQRDEYPMLGDRWPQDRMLLVLLDEMNLARTEYYFSDFLSKLELRRLVKNPVNNEQRKNAEIELDAGPGKGGRFRIWVGRNILFVGTMNEDETTQTLSDKVLDRANVLRFGMPADEARHSGDGTLEHTSERFLSREQWQAWHRSVDPNAAWFKEVQETITAMNGAMNYVGRPFGFRVRNAILQYVANYPRVNDDSRHKMALADQVEQKILPKLRGIDCNEEGAAQCLDELSGIIEALNDHELTETFKIVRGESAKFGMFQWRGVTRTSEPTS